MNFDRYKEELTKILDNLAYNRKRKRELLAEKKELQAEYLKANAEFQPGDRVRVFVHRDGVNKLIAECFIKQAVMAYNGVDITYDFVKIKKDGTPSKQSAGICFYDRIEKVQTELNEDQLIHLQYKMKKKL